MLRCMVIDKLRKMLHQLEHLLPIWSTAYKYGHPLKQGYQNFGCDHQGLRGLSYEERLRRCNLTNLEIMRSRGDLVEMFKILTGREDLLPEHFFDATKRTWI